jgi:NitT/TauT family transport system substrate-binding protein|tara:strand:+ start:13790 stop:14857 length:1068 start_codon:yes stop_codon:yes gene_type:complete
VCRVVLSGWEHGEAQHLSLTHREDDMHSLKTKRLVTLFSTAAVAALLAGAPAIAADDINVRFSWKLKGEYGFFYHGQEEGVYEERDLNVTFGEGAGAQAALGALLQGQEDVVVLPGIFAISAIQQGMPVKLVALYQPAAPIVLISHEDNPVTVPADLEGKSVAHAVGETGTSYLDAFCLMNDIDCGSVNKVQMDAGSRVPQFMQRQVDVVSVYQTNDLPVLVDRVGYDFPTLDLAEYGLSVPGLAAVVSDEALENNADALRRFIEATNEAIELTNADPDAATQTLMSVWSGGPSESVQREQIVATSDSIVQVEGHPFGWIEESAIADALALISSTDNVGELKPLDTFYSNALLTE